MPNPHKSELGYWHLHLPWNQEYINFRNTPNKFRRAVMQILIDQMINLIQKDQADYKTYTIISLPSLFDSQIAVVPDKTWFDGYFNRDTKEQRWLPLDKERNLIKEWNLSLPLNLDIKGFKELLLDDEVFEQEIWFIGELK
ncbi:DUF3916 domain-containing protein (plasmid) [Niallia taxi]|uniref:DUF3916 domain-containing protein n=1 Tax=Niallia TaxID=2837506 RepID=UPI001EF1056E|nr:MULTISPECIES: DUF3916 domain-containing protein [Niallia]MDK8642412.1 DUF3916 domain-containing protein [Niallia taxi]MED4041378.1 DUF3916 domain-containing protein [Niallia taxi]MED4057050.1 DUF3916 domain-containing protein [Niallia taxi]MED4121604.1 DUF3916 domain-containing protein [Niallia taxi]UPO91368.1 DUF3916 domain-containing protein [Niallia sp. Man26]